MKIILYALLFGALVCVRVISGQEAEGYSSIDWDDSSSSVIGYSETDLDDAAQAYYQAKVWAHIVDQNGTTLVGAEEIDRGGVNNGVISVTLDAPGQYNMSYTIHGTHSGVPYYSSQGGCPLSQPNANHALTSTSLTAQNSPNVCRDVFYDDFYFYESFGFLDTGTYWGDLFGPGPENDTPDSVIDIMSTEDSASVTPNCGDDRDTLTQEYATYHVAGDHPTCSSFTTGHSTPYFSVADLLECCPSHPNQEFGWILQSEEYLNMITAWYAQVTFPVNSAYRSPVRNAQCGGAFHPPSQHMFGDAMDAGNPSHAQSDWQKLYDAADKAGADWRESIDGPCGLGCVHGDMRYHGPTYVF